MNRFVSLFPYFHECYSLHPSVKSGRNTSEPNLKSFVSKSTVVKKKMLFLTEIAIYGLRDRKVKIT